VMEGGLDSWFGWMKWVSNWGCCCRGARFGFYVEV
jgi:hypothetical protein